MRKIIIFDDSYFTRPGTLAEVCYIILVENPGIPTPPGDSRSGVLEFNHLSEHLRPISFDQWFTIPFESHPS